MVATVIQLFGKTPKPPAVAIMAADLVAFATDIKSWEKKRHGVDHALLDIDDYALRQATQKGNVTLLAQAIAEARLQLPVRGKREVAPDGRAWWHGGWEDFTVWHAGQNGIVSPAELAPGLFNMADGAVTTDQSQPRSRRLEGLRHVQSRGRS